ncbi:hypothetical protein OHT57_12735 [Streptomyces sp. NBC_00285]|uniref:hypothetical protein n=1 Tax=Streptomyces sp. NBC_00285 TaxID=2975700 RepID=UPI002E2C074A|nr:hypothetical protein [Streptomyces sp. NBC_00285]
MSGDGQEKAGEWPPTPAAEQLRRRREAASRCEPSECGHRDPLDCTAAGCGETTAGDPESESEREAAEVSDFAQLWANARTAYFAGGFPKYASGEWRALHPDDPRRLAAALEAAEMWRKFGDEEALMQWFREAARSRPSIADRRTRAELDAAARPKPAHQLRATPGWPPVAVPGQPGRYLCARQEKAA